MAPLIVITGPTASGKSALALRLGRQWGGEIICADSRTVYKGLDVGTAKPTPEEREMVPHHLLDIVEPGERFTAYDFQQRARSAIADIRRRNKVPLLVGGTGLYIDSVVLDFRLGPDRDPVGRQQLEESSINELKSMLKKQHIPLPENSQNKRHLVRAVERLGYITSRKSAPAPTTHVVAIATERGELHRRIEQRVRLMFTQGVIEETRDAAQHYGWNCEALSGNIYKVLREYLEGGLSLEMAVERCVARDWRLVKRQMTWLRRHEFVRWLEVGAAEQYFDHILHPYRDEYPQ